jgi:hypothetical protein
MQFSPQQKQSHAVCSAGYFNSAAPENQAAHQFRKERERQTLAEVEVSECYIKIGTS